MLRVLALLAALVLTACTSDDEPPAQPATTACAEVRAGIDAFNTGDYVSTQEHFREALQLAQQQAEDDPSDSAEALLRAVKYYADLAPDDYPEAARSSPDFAEHKRTTLGQCVPPQEPDGDGTDGTEGTEV